MPGISAQTVVNIKKFGAKGDGKTDDTRAIQAAVTRVNALKRNVMLVIPRGTYLVRPQRPGVGEEGPYVPVDLLTFRDCQNITVKGESGARIQYASSLYYGAFERKNGRLERAAVVTTDYRKLASIGHGIALYDSKNVTIQGIEINGNNKSFIQGGEFGDVGFQIDNDGIFIRDCSDVTISNVFIHHFGRDGLQIINKTPAGFNTPSQRLVLKSSRFENNGRQGFSWTGGTGLQATGCSFSHTGKDGLTSPPGAGIDFEPNAGYIVYDGKFTNCQIKGNSGVGILSDASGDAARKISFSQCQVEGSSSPAIWIKSPDFSFTGCKIDGSYFFGYAARVKEDGTRFYNCVFSDVSIRDTKMNYIIESNGASYLLFSNCDFSATEKSLIYANGHNDEAIEFRNCTFSANYRANAPALQLGSFSSRTMYSGTTRFLQPGGGTLGWNIENSSFGNPEIAATEVSTSHRMATFGKVTIGKNNSRAVLNINDGGSLLINAGASLTIAGNGKLILKKGGTLWIAPGATLLIEGSLEAEAGSYICVHEQAIISKESLSRIKVNNQAFRKDNPQLKAGLSGCRKF